MTHKASYIHRFVTYIRHIERKGKEEIEFSLQLDSKDKPYQRFSVECLSGKRHASPRFVPGKAVTAANSDKKNVNHCVPVELILRK